VANLGQKKEATDQSQNTQLHKSIDQPGQSARYRSGQRQAQFQIFGSDYDEERFLTIQRFISLHQSAWQRLDDYLALVCEHGPKAIPPAELGTYARLYRKSVSDLAYARAYSPDHPVVRELEARVARAQATFYRPPAGRRPALRKFLFHDFPQTVVESWRPILLAFLIFTAAALAGFLLALNDLDFAYALVPAYMMDALSYHDLWTGHSADLRPLTSSYLATHNIWISLQAFALGLTLGVGTFLILLGNGVYLGAVLGAAAQFDMLGDLTAFVLPHGVLEIPEIVLSGASGFYPRQSTTLSPTLLPSRRLAGGRQAGPQTATG
jgi:uncharacterized membrane protein SpoIIM required for sporulation